MFKERVNVKPTIVAIPGLAPAILIHGDALSKMWQYVDQCADEIGWLGTAYRSDDNNIIVRDAFLFHQEVHSTTTEITPDGLAFFAQDLLSNDLESGMEIWNNLKVWGHSHVNMAVSPSGQDNSQMETFAQTGHDWFIRIIANKSGELKIDVYDYTRGITWIDTPWERLETETEETIANQIWALQKQLDAIKTQSLNAHKEDIKLEMSEKVKKKACATQGTWFTNGQTRWSNTGTPTNGQYAWLPYKEQQAKEVKETEENEEGRTLFWSKFEYADMKYFVFANDLREFKNMLADDATLDLYTDKEVKDLFNYVKFYKEKYPAIFEHTYNSGGI